MQDVSVKWPCLLCATSLQWIASPVHGLSGICLHSVSPALIDSVLLMLAVAESKGTLDFLSHPGPKQECKLPQSMYKLQLSLWLRLPSKQQRRASQSSLQLLRNTRCNCNHVGGKW